MTRWITAPTSSGSRLGAPTYDTDVAFQRLPVSVREASAVWAILSRVRTRAGRSGSKWTQPKPVHLRTAPLILTGPTSGCDVLPYNMHARQHTRAHAYGSLEVVFLIAPYHLSNKQSSRAAVSCRSMINKYSCDIKAHY